MLKLCTKCDSIGKGKHGLLSGNIYVGILEVVLGLTILAMGAEYLDSFIYGAVVAAIVTIAGLINVVDSFSDGRLCPNCGKDTMIPLDSLQADEIVRKKNLTLPEDSEN